MVDIWSYLSSKGFPVEPRGDKKVTQFVLDVTKLNKAQRLRKAPKFRMSTKLDGVYSLVTYIDKDGDVEVHHWSRTGKPQANCEKLDKHLKESLNDITCSSWVLISEITSDDDLASLSGYLNPNRVNEASWKPNDLKDNFHDILSIKGFCEGIYNKPYKDRERILHLFNLGDQMVPVYTFDYDFETALATAADLMKAGEEGAILRDPEASWVAGKRDETMIKVKEKLSFDCTVVGYSSGVRGSKYENVLGKLVVAFRAFGDPRGELLEAPISGMKDKDRFDWWRNPEEIVGKCVKVDAKSFTVNGNLREPRFKEIRNDKTSDFPVVLDGSRIYHLSTKGKANYFMREYT